MNLGDILVYVLPIITQRDANVNTVIHVPMREERCTVPEETVHCWLKIRVVCAVRVMCILSLPSKANVFAGIMCNESEKPLLSRCSSSHAFVPVGRVLRMCG